jgi:hypothetical protein
MRFFTSELIIMAQSNDDRVLNEQNRLWEEAGERYVVYLDTVRPRFPQGLRQLDERYYLHDATIRGMGLRDRSFVIVLQLDTPPQSLLTFNYDLVEKPTIMKGVLPPELCGSGSQVDWQYDEIEMVESEPPTWRQSILLSNGWELTLHFGDVQIEEIQPVLPAPRNGPATGVSFVPQQQSTR